MEERQSLYLLRVRLNNFIITSYWISVVLLNSMCFVLMFLMFCVIDSAWAMIFPLVILCFHLVVLRWQWTRNTPQAFRVKVNHVVFGTEGGTVASLFEGSRFGLWLEAWAQWCPAGAVTMEVQRCVASNLDSIYNCGLIHCQCLSLSSSTPLPVSIQCPVYK